MWSWISLKIHCLWFHHREAMFIKKETGVMTKGCFDCERCFIGDPDEFAKGMRALHLWKGGIS